MNKQKSELERGIEKVKKLKEQPKEKQEKKKKI